MPVLEFIYIWSRISAVVVLSILGLKGLATTPKVEIVEVPLEAGFGWEQSWWLDDDTTAAPDTLSPIQIRINKCGEMSEKAPEATARFFCKVQKVKLEGFRHIQDFIRKAYSLVSKVIPNFDNGYVMLAECLAICVTFAMTAKIQLCCLRMVMEKAYAVYNSFTRGVDARQVDPVPAEDDGVARQTDEAEPEPLEVGGAHEADRLGAAGGVDPTYQGSAGGRRFHEELAFQEGINEEVGASSEGVAGPEVDGKMRKEVRFSDDFFEDKGGARGSQRRGSPVKRMVPNEPVSKNCGAKSTRSVPAAGTAGAGSRASWNV